MIIISLNTQLRNKIDVHCLGIYAKELGVGYVNFVTSSRGIMGVATQRFFQRCVKEIENMNI